MTLLQDPRIDRERLEQWRRHCEINYWLDVTQGDPNKVAELVVRLTSRRGAAAAFELRDGMREAYKEWKKRQS